MICTYINFLNGKLYINEFSNTLKEFQINKIYNALTFFQCLRSVS